MEIQLPALGGSENEAWALLLDLYETYPRGWAVVGAQMVTLHAAHHGVVRPVRTRDTDVLVDIRTAVIQDFANWLVARDFELEGVSPDGIGHRFVRGGVTIDLLSIDHSPRESRTTLPPARTVEVPGGRQAMNRTLRATIHAGNLEGTIPLPDWPGAVLLKARAAVSIPQERQKHLRDLALLLGLPVNLPSEAKTLSAQERKRLRQAAGLMTDAILQSVAQAIDPRNAEIAMSILLHEPPE